MAVRSQKLFELFVRLLFGSGVPDYGRTNSSNSFLKSKKCVSRPAPWRPGAERNHAGAEITATGGEDYGSAKFARFVLKTG